MLKSLNRFSNERRLVRDDLDGYSLRKLSLNLRQSLQDIIDHRDRVAPDLFQDSDDHSSDAVDMLVGLSIFKAINNLPHIS